jgi:transketolase
MKVLKKHMSGTRKMKNNMLTFKNEQTMNGKISLLEDKSRWVRSQVLDMCLLGGGHLVSSFSCVEIIVALYYGGILNFDSKRPNWDKRDRFIMSKGHGAISLYAVLSDLGFFSSDELKNYCQCGCLLGSHPDVKTPGLEATTGSLGHGIGVAAGMALAAKMDGKEHMVVTLLGDGETTEGSVWETAMFASKRKLDNLVGITDRNQLCVTDFTDDCMGLEPLASKWESFGWLVKEIDGHDFNGILEAFKDLRLNKTGKPLMIIANTTKGKGVSFMENDPLWHTRIPSGEQIERAKKELRDSET